VVQHGSFRSAARALEMPKTTVSRKHAELEEMLGVPSPNRRRTLRPRWLASELVGLGPELYARRCRFDTPSLDAHEA